MAAVTQGDPTTLAPQPGADAQLLGKWYLKALIPDNDDNPESTTESTTPVMLTPLDSTRDIDGEYTALIQGHCHQFKSTLKKLRGPGAYLAESENTLMFFKPLPVKDHYVVYCVMYSQGRVIRTAKLIGRDMSRIQESLEALKKDASANGYDPDRVIIPRQTDTCPADEQ
uniref:Lipocalin 1 n=1 Tax=Rousettus aegyptiacus TaxID=9407 RepID=A0A7J8IKK7_ROUAE|nr:lipocalin 1 [Rousettus aegyptiacus]